KLPPDADLLELSLPAPRNIDSRGPAQIVVQPADNVELEPRPEAMIGLARDPPRTAESRNPGRRWQQPPFAYRTAVATAKFAAGMKTLTREITAESRSRLVLDPSAAGGPSASVRQEFSYQVRYEPIKTLSFLLPPGAPGLKQLRFRFDDVELAPVFPLDESEESGDSRESRTAQITLPQERLGETRVQVEYAVPIPKPNAQGRQVSAPLITPLDGQFKTGRLEVETPAGLQLESVGEAWTSVREGPRPRRDGPESHRFTSQEAVSQATFVLRREGSSDPTRVTREWRRTWLTSEGRLDQVCFRVETASPYVEFTTPPGADPSSVICRVDAVRARPRREASTWRVELPSRFGADASHLVEVICRFPRPGPWHDLTLDSTT
ncbi:MAG: hypothetical protein N2C14_08660, partial [Planctomycetales bacterium]